MTSEDMATYLPGVEDFIESIERDGYCGKHYCKPDCNIGHCAYFRSVDLLYCQI